ncbi:MAG: acyl--CoA ligase [Chloroflexi bacterium]|nr:acyl--CoA ligase [Chloroflexota bacterium]
MNDVGFILRRFSQKEGLPVDPNSVALVYQDERYSYAQLNKMVNRVANSLTELGVKKKDKVAVFLRNCSEWVFTYFALAKIGAILVPVNILFKAPEVEYILANSEVSYVIVQDSLIPVVEDIRANLNLVKECIRVGAGENRGYIDFRRLLEDGVETEPLVQVGLEDPFAIYFTSGTTGFPRGAIHTHGSVLWNNIHQIIDCKMTAQDAYLQLLEFCWFAGWMDFVLPALMLGGKVILRPSGHLDIGNVLELVEKEKATMCLMVPTVLKRLVEYPDIKKHDISSLRWIETGGAPVPVDVIKKFCQLFPSIGLSQVYGATECGSKVAILDPKFEMERRGSCGKAGLIYEVKVVDNEGKTVAPGETGELIVKSAASMQGYYKDDEKTRETLREGWFYTGDLAQYDSDGFLYIVGRKKELFISGGLNVYPAEVENIISSHPKVAEAAVCGIQDSEGKWGEVGKAFVRLKEGEVMAEEELTGFCRSRLATYKIPKYFLFAYEPLPRNVSGKVMKYKLQDWGKQTE